MGLLERDGKAKLTVIGERTFKEVVRENVDKDAIIFTDNHLSYQGLASEYAAHESVNHSQYEYKRGIVYTNSVEGYFSHNIWNLSPNKPKTPSSLLQRI